MLQLHSTTVLAVRHAGRSVMASDGQVTFGATVMKQHARKIRRLASCTAGSTVARQHAMFNHGLRPHLARTLAGTDEAHPPFVI